MEKPETNAAPFIRKYELDRPLVPGALSPLTGLLAYGKRMSIKLGIKNIVFLQGDLLDIPRMGVSFHHIDCVGVLHHLRDRMSGWRALERVLMPGGAMHIGVYSEVARMPVTFLRKEIAALNLKPSPRDMRMFRRLLLTRKRYKKWVKNFIASNDFFTLSTLRDMLFHVCENNYNLNEIKITIDTLKLDFLGFRIRHEPLKRQFLNLFPGDPHMTGFENWLRFEKAYAGTFQMYLFWLQKPEGKRDKV